MIHAPALRRFTTAKLGLFLSLLILSGCSVLPESETLSVYRLSTAPTATQPQVSSLPLVLRVATPYANRAVDSTRILVVPEADRISAYKGARWTDAAPVLLRDRLIEVFRASGAYRSVVTDSGNQGADLELTSDIYQYHVVYESGSPVVRVVLDATLSDPVSSRILDSRRFDIEQAVSGKEVPQVVQAFGAAVDTLAAQLLAWSHQQAAKRDTP